MLMQYHKALTQLVLFLLIFIGSFSETKGDKAVDRARLVNPMIGTGGHGHTFPGAVLPFGMIQVSPDTRIDGSWDGCSGYHYSDTLIYGFSHTHLSGTGCSDYGDILLMPTLGPVLLDNPKNYASKFRHKKEKAEAGYYAVQLDNTEIDVELTTTLRAGFHKYDFPKNQVQCVVLDLNHRDETLESELKIISPTRVEGFRRSKAWATNQIVYFSIEFSAPFNKTSTVISKEGDKNLGVGEKLNSKLIRAVLGFSNLPKQQVMVKVGISAVSAENARKNREEEISGWDFDKIKKEAHDAWNKELSKIEVKGGTDDQQTIFYTALYHTMIHPSLYTDVNGEYLGRDFKVHKAVGTNQYTVFSLWDTFRGLHPLLTLIDQKRTVDFINTFINQYEDGGRLPVWELSANETECMIGYHAVPVIADAMVKGLKGFDYEKAFQACKHSAMLDHFGLKAYKENGVITADDESESASRTLEYAFDDWCIAQMANLLGKTNDYKIFIQRAQSYKNLYDITTGNMRPRKNGGFIPTFDPREVNNYFTEGNSWQYSFFVPQDFIGLIGLHKGSDKLSAKLDELFAAPQQTTGRTQADITGLVGQYAHGNEPSHHMAYLYNYVGRPSQTQYYVHKIVSEFYKNDPDGLIGNEDCGQMSAWYVLSALGLYCVTPGSTTFAIGTPMFPEAIIHLENGKEVKMKANEVSEKNFYIQSAILNGKPYSEAFLSWADLQRNTELEFTMGEKSNDVFGGNVDDKWLTDISDHKITAVPVIQAVGKAFRATIDVAIQCPTPDARIHYTDDGTEPNEHSPVYTSFIELDRSDTLKAIAIKDSIKSKVTTAYFYKIEHDWGISIKGIYNAQYTAGGDDALIDGLRGEENWRKGNWQGYQGQDFQVLIDMKKQQDINVIGVGFLQDAGSWIIFPSKVLLELSADGKIFTKVAEFENKLEDKDWKTKIQNFEHKLPSPFHGRYLRVRATNYGKLPSWHAGAGGDAFIFVDEVWAK